MVVSTAGQTNTSEKLGHGAKARCYAALEPHHLSAILTQAKEDSPWKDAAIPTKLNYWMCSSGLKEFAIKVCACKSKQYKQRCAQESLEQRQRLRIGTNSTASTSTTRTSIDGTYSSSSGIKCRPGGLLISSSASSRKNNDGVGTDKNIEHQDTSNTSNLQLLREDGMNTHGVSLGSAGSEEDNANTVDTSCFCEKCHLLHSERGGLEEIVKKQLLDSVRFDAAARYPSVGYKPVTVEQKNGIVQAGCLYGVSFPMSIRLKNLDGCLEAIAMEKRSKISSRLSAEKSPERLTLRQGQLKDVEGKQTNKLKRTAVQKERDNDAATNPQRNQKRKLDGQHHQNYHIPACPKKDLPELLSPGSWKNNVVYTNPVMKHHTYPGPGGQHGISTSRPIPAPAAYKHGPGVLPYYYDQADNEEAVEAPDEGTLFSEQEERILASMMNH